MGGQHVRRELEIIDWSGHMSEMQIDTVLAKWLKWPYFTTLGGTEQSYYPARAKPRISVLDAFVYY